MPRLVRSLERHGNAEVWYDKARIGGADIWREEIDKAIDRTDIAILLVSQYFLLSDFIMREELPRLVKRAGEKQLVIFPILVGYCAWESVEALSRPQMMPGKPTPLVEYLEPPAKWDSVQYEILQALLRQIEKLRKPAPPPPPPPPPQTHPRSRSGWLGGLGNLLGFERKRGGVSTEAPPEIPATVQTESEAPQVAGDPADHARTQPPAGPAPPTPPPQPTLTTKTLAPGPAELLPVPPPKVVPPVIREDELWGTAGPRFGAARVVDIRPADSGLAPSGPRFGTVRVIQSARPQQVVSEGGQPRFGSASIHTRP